MATTDSHMLERMRHIVGADETFVEKFTDKAGELAFSLIAAALIIGVTFWLASLASKLIRRAIAKSPRADGADLTLPTFMASLVRYVIMAAGIVAAVQQLGVQTTSILAVFGAASLAVGLALQGALSNVAAGVMILLFRPYRVGDLIEVGGRTGKVEALDLFATVLSTPDNVRIVAPNGKVFGDFITNFSAYERRRVDATFRIDVKKPLAPVLAGLRMRAAEDPRILKEPAPVVEVTGMAELWVEGVVRAWVAREDFAAVKADLLQAAYLINDGAELPPPPRPSRSRRCGSGSRDCWADKNLPHGVGRGTIRRMVVGVAAHSRLTSTPSVSSPVAPSHLPAARGRF